MGFLNTIKAKVFGLLGLFAVGATNASAAVTYATATGFSGSIDLTAYETAITLVVVVIGIVIATVLGIKALGSAKRA